MQSYTFHCLLLSLIINTYLSQACIQPKSYVEKNKRSLEKINEKQNTEDRFKHLLERLEQLEKLEEENFNQKKSKKEILEFFY